MAEASAPVAIPIREIEEESATDPEISQLRECISAGDRDKASPRYKHATNEISSPGKLVLGGTRLLKECKRVLDLTHEDHQGLVKNKTETSCKGLMGWN